MSVVHVQGRCPACHHDSLELDGDHHVICAADDCPDLTAAARLLEQVPALATA